MPVLAGGIHDSFGLIVAIKRVELTVTANDDTSPLSSNIIPCTSIHGIAFERKNNRTIGRAIGLDGRSGADDQTAGELTVHIVLPR